MWRTLADAFRQTLCFDFRKGCRGDSIKVVGQHLELEVVVSAVMFDHQQQVTRMTESQRTVLGSIVFRQQMVDCIRIEETAIVLSGDLKQAVEFLLVRIFELDSVRDSSQERFVDQVRRFQVRGKDNQLFER